MYALTFEVSVCVRGRPVESDRISRGPWVKMLTSHMEEVGLIIVTEPENVKKRERKGNIKRKMKMEGEIGKTK
jgi:hypothetical protein